MKKYLLLAGLSLIVLVFLLSSCQTPSVAITALSTKEAKTPNDMPTPENGTSSVSGWVIQSANGKPYGNGYVNLAKVYRNKSLPTDGAFVLDSAHSPGTPTKQDGTFLFMNVKPGEYVFVIGTPDGQTEVYLGADGKPKVWKVDTSSTLDMGEIKTSLTP
jgi:hypothetical protein